MKTYNRYAFLCLSLAAATTHTALFKRHFNPPKNVNPSAFNYVAGNPNNQNVLRIQGELLIAVNDGDLKTASEIAGILNTALELARGAEAPSFAQFPRIVAPSNEQRQQMPPALTANFFGRPASGTKKRKRNTQEPSIFAQPPAIVTPDNQQKKQISLTPTANFFGSGPQSAFKRIKGQRVDEQD